MAVTTDTLSAAKRMKERLRELTDEQLLTLTGAWVGAWDSISGDFEEALSDLLDLPPGTTISRGEMARNRRLVEALDQAEAVLEDLYEATNSIVARDLLTVMRETVDGQREILASQLPDPSDVAPGVSLNIDSPAPDALNAIVLRSTETIHALTIPLAKWVSDKMRSELIRGITLGKNPRVVARRILRSAEGQFNGGLARALNIARTEMLDAHREAARQLAKENTDLITGWVWICTLDARTCPSCLAKHGSEHDLDEFGPIDHQSGRCARVDKVKSWRELGFNIEEPDEAIDDARSWYENLTEDTQRYIMGPTRYRLLSEGKIRWEDLTVKRKTDGWRDSYGVRSVKDLLDIAGEGSSDENNP